VGGESGIGHACVAVNIFGLCLILCASFPGAEVDT